MKAICKIDYGQFEYNKQYNYFYSYENNTKRYHVNGQYGNSEFTKRQFDQMFITENVKNEQPKNHLH